MIKIARTISLHSMIHLLITPAFFRRTKQLDIEMVALENRLASTSVEKPLWNLERQVRLRLNPRLWRGEELRQDLMCATSPPKKVCFARLLELRVKFSPETSP
jgi:hypothetical protein